LPQEALAIKSIDAGVNWMLTNTLSSLSSFAVE